MDDYEEFAIGEDLPWEWKEQFLPDDMEQAETIEQHDSLTLHETLTLCLLPTTRDTLIHVGSLYLCCWMHRIVVSLLGGMYVRLAHLSAVVFGCFLLHHFFGDLLALFLLHAALVIAVLMTSQQQCANQVTTMTAAASLCLLLSCELFFVDPARWHSVRGAQMIVMMKAVSAADALSSCRSCPPSAGSQEPSSTESVARGKSGSVARQRSLWSGHSWACPRAADTPGHEGRVSSCLWSRFTAFSDESLRLLGYLLQPGTCVFGPWIAFKDYLGYVERTTPQMVSALMLRTCVTSALFSLFWLSLSVCWCGFLIPDHLASYSVWLIAYREALSFRSSHYFVSFCSQTSMVLSGVDRASWMTKDRWYVSRPLSVELPNSLLEVVVNWNIPMHDWLKKYVFGAVRRACGSVAVALLATYSASALLHGLNFQLGAVLLSLGAAAYSQYQFRLLCLRWRPLPALVSLRLLLPLSTALHLVYLGVAFDGSAGSAVGYSWRHTLATWSRLHFSGHVLTLACLLLTVSATLVAGRNSRDTERKHQ